MVKQTNRKTSSGPVSTSTQAMCNKCSEFHVAPTVVLMHFFECLNQFTGARMCGCVLCKVSMVDFNHVSDFHSHLSRSPISMQICAAQSALLYVQYFFWLLNTFLNDHACSEACLQEAKGQSFQVQEEKNFQGAEVQCLAGEHFGWRRYCD